MGAVVLLCAGVFLEMAGFGPGAAAQAPRQWIVAEGADGSGTPESPFGRIQDALEAAGPGDEVLVRPGTYPESLRTVHGGTADRPIVVRAEAGAGTAVVTWPGKVLYANHPHLVVDGLVFDGQYGSSDTLDIENDADFLVLRRIDVRRSSADCIDINGPDGVLIEDSRIHHCLNATGGRRDAHGISAGHVRDLTIRGTEIHTFSGDGFTIDPDREQRGWDGVLLERCRIWLEPLARDENGFSAGTVPGENAVDLKARNRIPRGTITIRDTEAWGFRRGLISNMAAFNLKENVNVIVDGVTVWDSEIAFRLRGPTGSRPHGAWVLVQNSVIFDVRIAIRYENNLENFRLWNSTIGRDVDTVFRAARAPRSVLDVRNVLMLRRRLPAEARGGSNRAVGTRAFVDADRSDYRLAARSEAVDRGEPMPDVTADRDGVPRPQGPAYDLGAYERRPGDPGARR